MFHTFHLTFHFNSRVSHDFFKKKRNVNWHLHFRLKCFLDVNCLVIFVISVANVSIDMWVLFYFTSHTTRQFLNCAWQLTSKSFVSYYLFVQSFCMWNAKNLQKLYKKNTHFHQPRTTHHKHKHLNLAQSSSCNVWPQACLLQRMSLASRDCWNSWSVTSSKTRLIFIYFNPSRLPIKSTFIPSEKLHFALMPLFIYLIIDIL